MIINVTQEHINNGKPRTCSLCPVALALQEHFSDAWVGLEGGGKAIIWYNDSSIWALNSQVSKFVEKFDQGLPVEPFSFELELKNHE